MNRREFVLAGGWSAVAAAATARAQDHRSVILERARTLTTFSGQHIDAATPEIIEQAGRIASGTLFFYEHTPVNVGLKDIDWSGGHINNEEWPAQLNRFLHLRPLASAYQSTRDERYARAARAYIEDWLRGDTYATSDDLRPSDDDGPLTVSVRLGNSVFAGWGGTLPVFLASSAFDDGFLDRVLASMAHQAAFLSRHLTDRGNHRISELDAIVFTSLRFPFLPNVRELLETATIEMRNALATQFLPDGVHIERTPGYASWMTEVAANYAQLATLFPEANAGVKTELVAHALDYSAQSELFGVNDSLVPAHDPAVLSQAVYRAKVLARLGLQSRYGAEPPLEQVFPDGGQVFVRSAWKPGADYLAFDASSSATGGGHSHLSRLSFVLRSRGRVLVADPGTFSYEMSDPMASYAKSTRAHSTVNLNGWNQSGADARLLRTAFTPAVALIQARYEGGYWEGKYTWGFDDGHGRGTWGRHERVLFWVRGEYALVFDTIESDPGADAQNIWQLGPMDKWSHEATSLAWWSENRDSNLLLQMLVHPTDTLMQCYEGSRDPIRGWVGVHGDDEIPAPLVEFRYSAPSRSVVLLAPFSGPRPAYTLKEATFKEKDRRLVLGHLILGLPDGSTDEIAYSDKLALPVDNGQPFITDGVFVWRRTSPVGVAGKAFVLGGTYLK